MQKVEIYVMRYTREPKKLLHIVELAVPQPVSLLKLDLTIQTLALGMAGPTSLLIKFHTCAEDRCKGGGVACRRWDD